MITDTSALLPGCSKELKLLLLAGGLSTRMGRPKHQLRLNDGRLVSAHIVQHIKSACPMLSTCYVSVRRGSDGIDSLLAGLRVTGMEMIVVYDDASSTEAASEDPVSLGPAAGMCAVHQFDPESPLLVVACDFPLVTEETIIFLIKNYREPVTCYKNADGFCEPLLAIWSPQALQHLAESVKGGSLGPSKIIRMLDGHTIHPPPACESWLWNANTYEEWQKALKLLEE